MVILTQLHIMADNILLNRIGTSDDYDLISLMRWLGLLSQNSGTSYTHADVKHISNTLWPDEVWGTVLRCYSGHYYCHILSPYNSLNTICIKHPILEQNGDRLVLLYIP